MIMSPLKFTRPIGMAISRLHVISLISSIAGALAVMVWRVRETRTAVSTKTIVIPPMGMATGLGMFVVPVFRVPWIWAGAAFLSGALLLAYPLLRTSRLVREGQTVTMRRSNAFFVVLILLATIRIAARSYLDTALSVQQTSAVFFLVAFGMIVRWRVQMFIEYRALLDETIG
jgi:membrane protein CcdC involved in cytochrome C biogenesis